jgi:glycosyltransferase involved in cell wall biosynthesis
MATNTPLITVIIAVLNGADTIQRAIDSFTGQTYSNKEFIIIDGGSTDGTVEIIQKNSDKLTYWESKPDRGLGHAWNKAVAQSSGDWIYFLGADDYLWQPDTLAQLALYLIDVPYNVKIVYGKVNIITEDGTILFERGIPWDGKKLLHRMYIPHQGMFHHKSIFDIFGKFDEILRMAVDYDMNLRVLKNGEAVFLPDITIAGMGFGGMSYSPKNSISLFRENRLLHIKNDISHFPLYWVYLKMNLYWLLLYFGGIKNTQRIRRIYLKCISLLTDLKGLCL